MPTGTVHTLYLHGNELPPAGRSMAWLGPAERAELAMFGDVQRRRQWLAGRWVGKQLLVQAGVASRAADVEICSRDAEGRANRPRVRIVGRPFIGSLSIAHTAKGAMAALTSGERTAIGIDLVNLDDVAAASGSGGFARLWFSPLERFWIAADRPLRTATLWGIKEAVYKACQRGEAWSPRHVAVWQQTGGYRCTYRGQAIEGLRLEIEQIDGHLAVVASLLQIAQPPAAIGVGRLRLTPATHRISIFKDSSPHEYILGQAS